MKINGGMPPSSFPDGHDNQDPVSQDLTKIKQIMENQNFHKKIPPHLQAQIWNLTSDIDENDLLMPQEFQTQMNHMEGLLVKYFNNPTPESFHKILHVIQTLIQKSIEKK